METIQTNMSNDSIIALTADIVSAHVSNNPIEPNKIPEIINTVHTTLMNLGSEAPVKEETRPAPAVSVKNSIKPDYIVCLEDGKKLKMLKRYLRTNYNMSPEDYRARWNLSPDYPMVAPNYAERRRDLAKQIGLGRKPSAPATKAKSKAN